MSAFTIISVLTLLLTVLVVYVFIKQSIEKKRKQTLRILKALKQRANDFKLLLNGFPENFLSKDLSELVIRCLMNVMEQLVQLEPHDSTHLDSLSILSKQLEDTKRRPKNSKRGKLESPQQVKEVKRLLQELNKFILHFKNKGSITANQHKMYESQIKQLVIQMTVDNYIISAKQALGGGKTRLVVHYYTLAQKLLTRENSKGLFQKQIDKLAQQIAKHEQILASETDAKDSAASPSASQEEASSEWNKFEEEESEWTQRKNIYD